MCVLVIVFPLGVGHILGYDHETESAKIQQEMEKLFLECEAAQKDIVEEIEERKLQFNSKVGQQFIRKITGITLFQIHRTLEIPE